MLTHTVGVNYNAKQHYYHYWEHKMSIMRHYYQFTVYVVISTELNLRFNKESTIIMKLLIIAHNLMKTIIFLTLCCLNCLKMFCTVSWELDLWYIHELMGNFLRPKMFPPSPDNGKLYSLSTQGHSHKVPLKQLYVLSAISNIMCRKGAEPEHCIRH